MITNDLKISIVTVCYNAVDTIEETMLSVLNQTYPNVEYILIDGGSADGTVDIIKKYSNGLAYWVSEPDKGIFDAMNKGISLSTGSYINFMNAGDKFYDENVISKVFSSVLNSSAFPSVIYGDVLAVADRGVSLLKSSPIHTIKRNMPFCHQSSFVDSDIAKKLNFDITFRASADFNMFMNIYKSGGTFLQVDYPIAIFEAQSGFSSTNKAILINDVAAITKRRKAAVKFEYWLREFKHLMSSFSKWHR